MNSIDLVSLIEQHSGIRLVKEATTDSGEYWGMCPFCKAGDNRFHVWPNSGRPHWWCRVCEMSGDAIQFLRDYCGLSYVDACLELGIDVDTTGWTREPMTALPDVLPPKQWQEAATVFLERAERYLWHPKSPDGQQMLAYLRARGLRDETIKQARLGCCPLGKDGRWYSASYESWGLTDELLTDAQRAKECLRIPPGIIIPWLEGKNVWKLAVKRPGEKKGYVQVTGSREGLYGVDTISIDKPCMMVEGEFDCLSVIQEAGDLVSCVATGSTTHGRYPRWIGELACATYVLQSFDVDMPDEKTGLRPGEEGATYWQGALSHCTRWAPWADERGEPRIPKSYRFKDTNDILQYQDEFQAFTGTTLRGWVQAGMEVAEMEPLWELPTAPTTLARETEPLLVAIVPDYSAHIAAQEHFERLCVSERVETPEGPGTIWDRKQLRAHLERGLVRVALDSRQGAPSPGATALFTPEQLEPCIELDLSF